MLNRVCRLIPAISGVALLLLCCGCRSVGPNPQSVRYIEATNLLETMRSDLASDGGMIFFRTGIEPRGSQLVLTGLVDSAEVRTAVIKRFQSSGVVLSDETELLPAANLGDQTWGICTLSLGNGREYPEHKAELGTQLLLGEVVRILKGTEHATLRWFLVRSKDGYVAWQQTGNIVQCTRDQANAWMKGPLLIVTNLETQVRQAPDAASESVCDLVLLNLVTKMEGAGGWTRIKLPDGRQGYIETGAACDYKAWKASRQPSPENIERTARQFTGRPYLWGGNAPHGLDCSGFTKTVFALNGIELRRNASHQARQGTEVSLANDFSDLRKGDLLFFGRKPADGKPQKVTHVAIYLGDKTFIHSAERVQISSLDPNSPERDARHSSRLLCARRILPVGP